MIDVEEELKILENSVRDIIAFVLFNKYGAGWINNLKIPPDRINNWNQRLETETRRLKGSPLETRLIYYADFYDLRSIIDRHWDDGLLSVFLDKRTITIFLEEAEKLRDPHAHRRELFDYQKHLVKGISGEIRTRIMKYRGKQQNPDDFFPVIEAVNDNMGNGLTNPIYAQMLVSDKVLKVGDSVEITVYSVDPLGGEMEYSIARIPQMNWTRDNRAIITFEASDIGRSCDINILVRSTRDYHAYSDFDHYVSFRYIILPQ